MSIRDLFRTLIWGHKADSETYIKIFEVYKNENRIAS